MVDEETAADRAAESGDVLLRFSLAGVQLKFSMVRTSRGLTLPASGIGGDWLVKLPDRRYESVPENEFAMLRWMSLAGLEVPPTRLVSGAELDNLPAGLLGRGEKALAVARFDRPASGRVHMEDLAQVADVYPRGKYKGASYDSIARLLTVLCPADVDEYVRRLVAVVLMGNTDAHLKNWTLLYTDGITPRLSPVYDFVCITVYEDFARHGPAFRLGGAPRFPLVTRDSFRRLAQRAGLDESRVVDVVDRAVDLLLATWKDVIREAPVPPYVADHIELRLHDLPLARGV